MFGFHIAANVLAAAFLCAVFLAVGARLRGLARLPVPPGYRIPVDFAAGAWLTGTLLLFVALLNLANPYVLTGVVVILALLGRWRGAGRQWSGAGAAAVGGLLSLPVALAPPFFYDAMVYHLALPWQMLFEGGAHAHPENLFSTFPPLAQLLSLPPLAVGLHRVPALLHWCSWVATGAAAVALARSVGASTWTARLVGLTCLLLPATAAVPGFPAAEGWFLVATVAAVGLAAARPRPGSAMLVGLLVGIATSARLQGLPWTVVILGLVAWRSRSLRSTATAGAAWLIGALPWWFKNLVLLQDPMAPVFWNRDGMETLWRDSASLLKQGLSPVECLAQFVPRIAPEISYLLPIALVAAVAMFRSTRARETGGLASVGLAVWLLTGALPRFLSISCVLLLVTAAAVASQRMLRMAAVIALMWFAIIGAVRNLAVMEVIDPLRLIPLTTVQANARLSPNDPMAAFEAARTLPGDSLVLFTAEPRSFGFPQPYVTSSQHDPSPLRPILARARSPKEATALLRAEGFSHLLVNWAEMERLGSAYPVTPWREAADRELWISTIRSLGPPAVDAGHVKIYQLGYNRLELSSRSAEEATDP